MSTKKFFINKMSDKIVTKFPDPIQTNSLFEVAQAMVDQGKDPKEIKKILKDLYGASKDELERLDDKFFKNKVNAATDYGDPIREELATIRNEMHELISRLENIPIPAKQEELVDKVYDIVHDLDLGFSQLHKVVESLELPKEE
jgi:polyhydroxyalkanoate synthesis regulator phasin